jgi:hypothetical protein
MERTNKVRDLIFNYLDILFSRAEIAEADGSIVGVIGNELLFTYFPNRHNITFSSKEFRTICNMFGSSDSGATDYIKVYLSKNVKPEFITASFNPYL